MARVCPHERALVAGHLSPAQAALFWRMARWDQRHSLDVFHTLRGAGHEDEALLQAALLHDAGKAGGKLTLWHRAAVVLMNRFAPQVLERLAADGHGWRAPFAAHGRHPATGARWAMEAGSSADVGELIYRHHSADPDDKRLAALQWADRQN